MEAFYLTAAVWMWAWGFLMSCGLIHDSASGKPFGLGKLLFAILWPLSWPFCCLKAWFGW